MDVHEERRSATIDDHTMRILGARILRLATVGRAAQATSSHRLRARSARSHEKFTQPPLLLSASAATNSPFVRHPAKRRMTRKNGRRQDGWIVRADSMARRVRNVHFFASRVGEFLRFLGALIRCRQTAKVDRNLIAKSAASED
uniref:Uncharacterized protein n=1 Tax=Plectus sambesii TaxID=2011161 RepID=A0A914V0X2_9BILA